MSHVGGGPSERGSVACKRGLAWFGPPKDGDLELAGNQHQDTQNTVLSTLAPDWCGSNHAFLGSEGPIGVGPSTFIQTLKWVVAK